MEATKMCTKCKRILPTSEFRWRNKAQGKLHSQCKSCEKERDKIYYQQNGNRRELAKERATTQKAKNLLVVEEAKQNGCQKCGDKRLYVLDFHHIDTSQKVNTINHMIKSASTDQLKKEIEKCGLLCANCHREFHYLESAFGITFEEYLNNQY